ncbi:type II and III secretion system protein family protein [Brucella haematophila]|uniref:type II and III secretion system protein family protein n=1 Tax=Brucella haematophila TaxID=419474 RepID=UPI00110D7DE3|nr:type II and III secretion system protein family protein [Brucella haematophila]TMV05186.1 type II and III secretion system protein family protein [Brucella haematophila]
MKKAKRVRPYWTKSALIAASLTFAAQPFLEAPAMAAGGVVKVGAQGRAQRITLGLNKSLVLDLPQDAYDVLVSNPSIADAVTSTSRRIYLFGKQVGQTNIFVFGPNGEQIASIDVEIERDVSTISTQLKRLIPGSDIRVELINDNVVLTGTVQTPQDSAQAAKLAGLFVTGGEATTGQYSSTASAPTDGGGVAIDNPDRERRVSKIVNMLTIVGEDQVTLKVTVAEVSRTVMKQLGVNMLGRGNSNGITYSGISETISGAIGNNLSDTGFGLATSSFSAYLRAMESAGVMKTLAEPTLTAISGEKAAFNVGGEYNVLNSVTYDDDGKRTNQLAKIEYGIGLEFMPVVLGPGRISLKIRTSVSEPTTESTGMAAKADGVGTSLLSLRKRVADTTVELPSGGSMMIGGLIRDEVRQSVSGFPGLTKIPVLGALFRSKDFIRNESELVVIVTPYLARPVARQALARPDDNLNPASDGAGYILGKVNRVYGTMETKLPPGRYNGVVGYIYK